MSLFRNNQIFLKEHSTTKAENIDKPDGVGGGNIGEKPGSMEAYFNTLVLVRV